VLIVLRDPVVLENVINTGSLSRLHTDSKNRIIIHTLDYNN